MRFEVIEETIVIDNICNRVYGISYIDKNNKRYTFPDLTDNFESVEVFINNLNLLKPDFSQLEYLIEDFCFAQN